ncbi:MAG: 4Fe-4S binding protein [Eubacteriales bacterium]
MNIAINENRCPQNHRCPAINQCPVGAISQEGYGLPVIDQEKCIHCSKCVMFCPMQAIFQTK